jgi:hypothetical protein
LGPGFRLSPLELEMALEKNYHGFWKLEKLNKNPFKEMNKPKNHFENGED